MTILGLLHKFSRFYVFVVVMKYMSLVLFSVYIVNSE